MEDYYWCNDCAALGDDYYCDNNGKMVCACDDCVHNPNRDDDWEE